MILTCNSCCCTCYSFPGLLGLLDTQRRKRTPEFLHHATPGGVIAEEFQHFKGLADISFLEKCKMNKSLEAIYTFCHVTPGVYYWDFMLWTNSD